MTSHPNESEYAESEKKVKQKEETKNIRAAIDAQHKKWYDNLAFFIISLIFASLTFIGGYFVRMDVLTDSVIQAIVFVVTVGFFVLPLSWLFNKFWKLFLKE